MPDQRAFDNLWADAVVLYEDQTDRKIDADVAFREFKTLGELEGAIEKENRRFGSFRNEHRKVYSALKSCIAPMEPILGLVQKGIGNTPYAPASVVFGAAAYLLQSCTAVSKSYDGIEELFQQMSNITVRLKEYEFKNLESSLSKKITDILAFFLDIIGKAEAAIKRKRIRQWARSVFLKDDSIGIGSSVTKLQKYIEAELGLVIALTYGRVTEVQNTVVDTQADVKVVKASLNDILTNQRSDRHRAFSEADEKKLSDALKTDTADEVAREHVGNWEKLTKGTAIWIRDDVMFGAWEQEEAPCLWVFGKPGVGKTMLAARTIETLQSRYPQHSDIPSLTSVSYLYFKDDNPKLQDCAQMWKTAALQITKANDRFKKHVLATIQKKQDTFASARQIWKQLFLDFFQEDLPSSPLTSLAFIVIDGLDEAPQAERVKLLTCLSELVNRAATQSKCRIQVAVFARPDVRADPGFEKVSFRMQERLIEVTPDRNTVDIELYVKQRLSDVLVLQVLKKRKATKEFQTLAKQIYNSVLSKSQGMFLWARLVFDQLRASPSPEAIKGSLQGAPVGLDEMLYHVFKRLEVDEELHRPYLKDLIAWVYFAYRPLYVSELFILILVGASQHCYMIEDDLKARYSSLFDIIGPSVENEEDQAQAVIDQDETATDVSTFDFLDGGENSRDDDTGSASDQSDHEDDERQSQTRAMGNTGEEEAEEQTFDIPLHWHETTVTFSHARIRDYPKNRRIPKTAAVTLARQLSALFYSGEGLLRTSFRARNEFIETWFSVSKYSSLVRKIIGDYAEDVDEDQKEWAVGAAKSARTLFQPLRAACARTWLTKTGWDDPAYLDKSEKEVWIMFAFSTLTDDGDNEGSVDIFNVDNGFWNIALDTLEKLANSEPVPKSAHFYAGVAWILMEAMEDDYTYRAIEYFKKALDLLPGGWMPMEGLARCYGENLSDYETAIQWMEDAIRNVPQTDDLSGIEFYLETRISDWKLQLGDDQESVKIAQTSYEASKEFTYGNGTASDSSILRSIKHYIETLYRTHQYSRVVELIRDLDARETYEQKTSLWMVFIQFQTDPYHAVDLFNKIGKITQVLEDDSLHEFLRVSFKKVMNINPNTIADYEPIWLAYNIAEWQYHYAPNPEESIESWEKIVTLVDQSNEIVQQSQNWFRSKAAAFLSMMLFDAAKENHHTGKDPSAYITKIESLAQHKQGSRCYYRASYPALILGLWLHEYMKAKEEIWSACIRPSVKQALYLLGDQDPWNDQEAYSQLGQALFAAGDILNGSIAYGVTLRPLEDHRKELEQQEIESGAQENDSAKNGPMLNATNIGEQLEEPIEEQISRQQTTGRDTFRPSISDTSELEVVKDLHHNEGSSMGEKQEIAPGDSGDNSYDDDGKLNDADNEEEEKKRDENPGSSNNDDDGELDEVVNPKYAGFGYLWVCDGPCDTSQSDYTELWSCRVCQDCCFCEKCVELHRRDEIPSRVCAVDHPLVRIFPTVAEAKELTDALVEMRFEIQQKWLNGLRKTWED
ncbi:hypothetical protein ACLMJK_005814 [Lecanora helva]